MRLCAPFGQIAVCAECPADLLIIPLLGELHLVRVPERIRFQLCVLTFRCLHGVAPSNLADGRRHLSSGGQHHLAGRTIKPPLDTRRLRLSRGCGPSVQ